jgi:hypothetical protein
MDLNRNQFFMAGLVILFLGIQLRMVEVFVLNEQTSQFLAQRISQLKGEESPSPGQLPTLFAAQAPVVKKRVQPPPWLGWALVSIGSVLVLHSLAMKKPGA